MNVIVDSGALYGLRMFGSALALGVVFGALKCLTDVLAAVFSFGRVGVGVTDFIYWCVSGFAAFLLILSQNSGVVRGYIIFGCLAGALLFGLTVGAAVRRLTERLLSKIRAFFDRSKRNFAAKRRIKKEKNKKQRPDTCKKKRSCI